MSTIDTSSTTSPPHTRGLGLREGSREVSPPHTRGSAARRRAVGFRIRVSPAHAGIGLVLALSMVVALSLPRTRGDRPHRKSHHERRRRSPPHTRGSAPRLRGSLPQSKVSPAHAGIGLRSRVLLHPCFRLPRTRGDRPSRMVSSVARSASPPHTRGSASPGPSSKASTYVSPAHAGIGRLRAGHLRSFLRLPRTRRDRPHSGRFARRLDVSPPHTRGSAVGKSSRWHPKAVSPAHAGIGRSSTLWRRVRLCLPRTRGDRPENTHDVDHFGESPPHTRGSAPSARSRRLMHAVSPCQ